MELEEEEPVEGDTAVYDGAARFAIGGAASSSSSPPRSRFFPMHSAKCLSPAPAAPRKSSPSARRCFTTSCCSVPSPQQAPIWASCCIAGGANCARRSTGTGGTADCAIRGSTGKVRLLTGRRAAVRARVRAHLARTNALTNGRDRGKNMMKSFRKKGFNEIETRIATRPFRPPCSPFFPSRPSPSSRPPQPRLCPRPRTPQTLGEAPT